MSAGFYERLGLQPTASPEEVREAYHRALAKLVKKLRAARSKNLDAAAIEAERDGVREAWEVLNDPTRRRRYHLMLDREGELAGLDVAALLKKLQPALVDPAAAAGVELLRALTDLPVGPAMERPAAPPPPEPPRRQGAGAVSMLSGEERAQRAHQAVLPVPEPAGLRAAAAATAPIAPNSPAAQAGPQLQLRMPSLPMEPEPMVVEVEEELAAPGPLTEDDLRAMAAHLGHDGRYVAAVRKHRGMELDELSRITRISARYLQAIEDNAFDRLPAAVFVRGYLKEIASTLEIDEGELIRSYMALYSRARGS
ncbi:MAG: helix-turn-helix domain-containing protein [Deltaproteobacteria bacterium]|nr:helix-turn-helix domain-containing protein [Deltaproteobacteria bacterium]